MTRNQALLILGVSITLLGCFLPWASSGGVIGGLVMGMTIYSNPSIDPFYRLLPLVIGGPGIPVITLTLVRFSVEILAAKQNGMHIISAALALIILILSASLVFTLLIDLGIEGLRIGSYVVMTGALIQLVGIFARKAESHRSVLSS
jgi:hypothetical protein